jgi:hypothetical protein
MNVHTQQPAEPQDTPLYLPTDVSPEQIFQAIGRLRKEARDEIERLLTFLDDTDNHMEREPEDEGDDSELEEDDPAEDDGLREPSLGAIEGHDDQAIAWASGGRRDLEQDGAESGIGDQDGLDEQVPFRDWQNVGMV